MSGQAQSARYEIRVEGGLDSNWSAWFDGLQVTCDGSETLICGLLPDQPALHGLLAKIRDLGLCLTSVHRLEPHETGNERGNGRMPDFAHVPSRLPRSGTVPAHDPQPEPGNQLEER